ncbi:hypothetical protein EMMF5_005462 [Cystobasidiomycetes sp. EMM_F5]
MDTAAAVINAIAFDATGADIIICTPAMDASASPTGAAELVQAFYAQRKVLAGVSPVFADMLELGRNEEVTQGLPVVQLNDSGAMMEILLRSISHKMDAQPDLVGLPLKMIMALWSASHRYQMSLLQNLVQTTVRYRSVDDNIIPALIALTCMYESSLFAARKIAALETVQAWSEIYVRAIKFQVPSLRELALINLVRWKPDHWPVELLAEIDPFGVLLEVVSSPLKACVRWPEAFV